jgi:hypothetical protein
VTEDIELADLTGTVDERLAQLAEVESAQDRLPAGWLHRQLKETLAAWAADDTELDITSESRADF